MTRISISTTADAWSVRSVRQPRYPTRRAVLRAALGAAVGLALPIERAAAQSPAPEQPPAARSPAARSPAATPGAAQAGSGEAAAGSPTAEPATGWSITPVADRIALISGVGGNVLALSTDEGRVLVDSGAAEHAGALRAALDELPGTGRVRALFNSHWHLDQVGGNAAFGAASAQIIAHEKTRLRLATDYWLPDEERYRSAMPADAQPTHGFFTRGEATFGDEHVEYGYLLEAHTDGDIYVHFRGANVVAVGDALSPARDPELDWFGGGWIGGRVDALAQLLELGDAGTRFVPSYGPVVGRAAVAAEHDMMLMLFDRMLELIRMGLSAEDMVAEGVMDGIGRDFENPLKFVDAAHRGLWGHHNNLTHDIV